jgi:hypothetical protein
VSRGSASQLIADVVRILHHQFPSNSGPPPLRERSQPSMSSSKCPRPRRRSRYGCRNCKIRKVKVGCFQHPKPTSACSADPITQCDESKPQCKRCISFGLSCPFMSDISDLQTTGQRLVIQRPVTSAVWISDASTTYHLNARCRDFITRYYQRSLVAPDDPRLEQVNRKLLDLAFTVSSQSLAYI